MQIKYMYPNFVILKFYVASTFDLNSITTGPRRVSPGFDHSACLHATDRHSTGGIVRDDPSGATPLVPDDGHFGEAAVVVVDYNDSFRWAAAAAATAG